MSGRVIVVGSINEDLVLRVARLPGPGETLTGATLERHAGGKGGNQAVAAARLGALTLFIGAVGDDDAGSRARASLANEGIDLPGLAVLPDAETGTAVVLVEASGENSIVVAPGANALVDAPRVAAALARTGIRRDDVLLVSCEVPVDAVRAALEAAREAGARSVLNPAPAAGLPLRIVALGSILTPNEGELALLAGFGEGDGRVPTGPAQDFLVRCRQVVPPGPEAVVVTLGARGVGLVPAVGAATHIPALEVEVVDTTGAGDALNGALAAGLAEGRELEDAVQRAVAAAALATTRVGAREGMPDRAHLERLVG